MNKRKSMVLILIGYLIAYIIGEIGYLLLDASPLFKGALFYLLSTLVIYVFGVCVENTSFYDPFWSLTPFVLILFMMIMEENRFNLSNILFLGILFLYSLRLTLHWALSFKGLKEEDFRYKKYRDHLSKTKFELMNFFGFMMMPSLLVFLALIPGIAFISYPSSFNYLYLIGYFMMLLGIILELISDIELKKWKKDPNNQKRTIRKGLWAYSRHPNYLGEIIFFFGIAILELTKSLKYSWIMLLGATFIFLLFIFASIPMMEVRELKNKVDYRDYQKEVSVLLLLPRRKTHASKN